VGVDGGGGGGGGADKGCVSRAHARAARRRLAEAAATLEALHCAAEAAEAEAVSPAINRQSTSTTTPPPTAALPPSRRLCLLIEVVVGRGRARVTGGAGPGWCAAQGGGGARGAGGRSAAERGAAAGGGGGASHRAGRAAELDHLGTGAGAHWPLTANPSRSHRSVWGGSTGATLAAGAGGDHGIDHNQN
jgi:hypothetical protein